jgi:endonuclease IV
MIERIAPELRGRVGVCVDTCHVWVAGYDVLADYDGVFKRFGDAIGLDRLQVFHCNDSLAGRGAGAIGTRVLAGTLGEAFFRRLIRRSFRQQAETHRDAKGHEHPLTDRRNIGWLRRYRLECGA